MSSFGDSLRKIRKDKNLTLDELAALLGTSKQVLSRYENGQRSPKVSIVADYADKLGLTISELTSYSRTSSRVDGLIPRQQIKIRRAPVLGDTAAGQPITANREYDEWVYIPDDGHTFDAALRIKGDSMLPKYHDGDLVLVRYQDDVLNGQVAVVQIDDDVTLKRVYHVPGGLSLLSDNPDYPPLNYTEDDVNNAHLVGLAVGVLHWDY